MPLKFTLDINCIIDLEESRENAVYLQHLVYCWEENKIDLAVAAISASENQENGNINQQFFSFEDKLARIGLKNINNIYPPAIWGFFYWGKALWCDEKMKWLISETKEILFPNCFDKQTEDKRKYRNRLCDVLLAVSHIYHKRDFLVTSDKNFFRKKDKLKEIGVKGILSPEDAAKLCENL